MLMWKKYLFKRKEARFRGLVIKIPKGKRVRGMVLWLETLTSA